MDLEITNVFLTRALHSEAENADENTDVIVEFESGEQYIASFFSFQSLNRIRSENLKKGAFLKGKYFWSQNMILIDDCKLETITPVVHHLIEEGNFKLVFRKL